MRTFLASVQDEDGVLVTKIRAKNAYDALQKAIVNLMSRTERLFSIEEVSLMETTDEEKEA